MIVIKALPSLSTLESTLSYNPDTGEFYHLKGNYKGKRAGFINSKGYRQIKINGLNYFESRLAWKMYHKEEPSAEIDHINRIKDDNRISNLRSADRSLNCLNQAIRKDNTSGVKGVSWYKKLNKWVVQVSVEGHRTHLGYFDSLEEAAAAREVFLGS